MFSFTEHAVRVFIPTSEADYSKLGLYLWKKKNTTLIENHNFFAHIEVACVTHIWRHITPKTLPKSIEELKKKTSSKTVGSHSGRIRNEQ